MAFGTDFNSATLIDMSTVISGELQSGDADHYFRVAPKANTDYIYVHIPDRQESVYLYDSTETLITSTSSSQSNPQLIVDATQTEYFIRVSMGSAGPYTMYVFASVNGVFDGYNEVVGGTHEVNTGVVASKPSYMGTLGDKTAPITSDKVRSSESTRIVIDTVFKAPKNYFNLTMVNLSQARRFVEPIKTDFSKVYRIEGTVKREGVAVSVLMRLYDRKTGLLICETQSDPAGNYVFQTRLHKDSKYYVIAFDDMENPDLQAVVHDALIPIKKN